MDQINEYKYPIGGSILILFLYGIYSSLSSGNTEKVTVPKSSKKESTISSDEFKKFMKLFSNELQNLTLSLMEFNANKVKSKSFKSFQDEIFTKDIEKKNILIDSFSLRNIDSEHNTSDYKINFDHQDFPDSFKNVIGIRLVNATMPHSPYQVTSNNNSFYIKYGNKKDLVSLGTGGSYTFEQLGTLIQNSLNSDGRSGFVVTPGTTTFKYTISNTSHPFYFLWKSSNNLAYRLIGALNIDDTENYSNNTIVMPHVVDQNLHFIDVVVDEIPAIACKLNSHGMNIIARIPLTTGPGAINYFRSPEHESQTQNYFYPIKLSSMTIKLYDTGTNNYYDSSNSDHSLEFELTIIKNTKLFK